MSHSLLLAFWAMTFLLIVVPGPDWAFVLASGVHDNVVFSAVIGIMAGYAILAGVVAAGVGALVSGTPGMLTALTMIGAGYLLYLGATMLATPGGVHEAAPPNSTSSWGRTIKGVGVSSLNPKGLLIFLALLPQFTDPNGRWPIPLQIGALGLVFVLTCGIFYSAIGLSARAVLRSHDRDRPPAHGRTVALRPHA
jgi:threonine/homoserine/homoserine lactone efflux protein